MPKVLITVGDIISVLLTLNLVVIESISLEIYNVACNTRNGASIQRRFSIKVLRYMQQSLLIRYAPLL